MYELFFVFLLHFNFYYYISSTMLKYKIRHFDYSSLAN